MSNKEVTLLESFKKVLAEHEELLKQDYEEKLSALTQDLKDIELIKHKIAMVSQNTSEKIRLNVGGKIFETFKSTLTKEKPSFFSALFSEQFAQKPDEKGEYFIDRNPWAFSLILEYFRTNILNMSHLTPQEKSTLELEIDFYQIPSLIKKTKKVAPRKIICKNNIELNGDTIFKGYNCYGCSYIKISDSFVLKFQIDAVPSDNKVNLEFGFTKDDSLDCTLFILQYLSF